MSTSLTHAIDDTTDTEDSRVDGVGTLGFFRLVDERSTKVPSSG